MLDLRRARLDDPEVLPLIDEVQRYYVEIYGGADDDPADPAEFAPPAGGFLLGSVDGSPAAMGGWTFTSELPGTAKIRRMYVRPAFRRAGHARRLLEAVEADARAAGATRAALTTGPPQRDAIAFYRSVGYTDVAPFGFYADVDSAVHLGKPLRPHPPIGTDEQRRG